MKYRVLMDFCDVNPLALKIVHDTFMTILEKFTDAKENIVDRTVTIEAVIDEDDKAYLEKEFNGWMTRKALNKAGAKISFEEIKEGG